MSILRRYIDREFHESWKVLVAVAFLAPLTAWLFRERQNMLGGVIVFCGVVAALGIGTDIVAGERRGHGMSLLRRLPGGLLRPFVAKFSLLSVGVLVAVLYATIATMCIVPDAHFDALPKLIVTWVVIALALAYALFAASASTRESGVCVLLFIIGVLLAIVIGRYLSVATDPRLKQDIASQNWFSWSQLYDPRGLWFWLLLGSAGLLSAGGAFLFGLRFGDVRRLPAIVGCGVVGLCVVGVERGVAWRVAAAKAAYAALPNGAVISRDERFALVRTNGQRVLHVDLKEGVGQQLKGDWRGLSPNLTQDGHRVPMDTALVLRRGNGPRMKDRPRNSRRPQFAVVSVADARPVFTSEDR